jgi:hypothetical protein
MILKTLARATKMRISLVAAKINPTISVDGLQPSFEAEFVLQVEAGSSGFDLLTTVGAGRRSARHKHASRIRGLRNIRTQEFALESTSPVPLYGSTASFSDIVPRSTRIRLTFPRTIWIGFSFSAISSLTNSTPTTKHGSAKLSSKKYR